MKLIFTCDLTPLDFYLWGYVKDKVYANHPLTIDDLKRNIRREIAEISAPMLGNVVQNIARRLAFVLQSRGEHIKDIIFHT